MLTITTVRVTDARLPEGSCTLYVTTYVLPTAPYTLTVPLTVTAPVRSPATISDARHPGSTYGNVPCWESVALDTRVKDGAMVSTMETVRVCGVVAFSTLSRAVYVSVTDVPAAIVLTLPLTVTRDATLPSTWSTLV